MVLIFTDLHAFMKDEKEKTQKSLYSKPSAVFLLGDIRAHDAQFIRSNYSGPIYYIYGNHDEYGDYDEIPGLINFHGKVVKAEGHTFIGIEGCVRYKDYGVAHTQKEIIDLCDKLPYCDFIFSHEGPKTEWSTKVSHEGYQGINNYLKKYSPQLCIHGHRHTNKLYTVESVQCVALYKCAEFYIDKKQILRAF